MNWLIDLLQPLIKRPRQAFNQVCLGRSSFKLLRVRFMENKKFKKIGILGGMGPVATVNMYNKIVLQTQRQCGAVQDTEYPPVIVYSLALEGFNETGIADFDLVEKQLLEGIKCLEEAGADLIVIACNTVHYFYDKIQAVCSVPILHLIREATKYCGLSPYQKIGLVSSQTTSHEGLYHQELKKYSQKEVIVLAEAEQELLNKIVLTIMSGGSKEKVDALVTKVASKLKEMGSEVILVGCTELSLAFNSENSGLPVIDAVDVLAELAVKMSNPN